MKDTEEDQLPRLHFNSHNCQILFMKEYKGYK
jgi:hypothetical protein